MQPTSEATDRISRFLDVMIEKYKDRGSEIDKTKTIQQLEDMAKTYDSIPYEQRTLADILAQTTLAKDKYARKEVVLRLGNCTKPAWAYSEYGLKCAVADMDPEFFPWIMSKSRPKIQRRGSPTSSIPGHTPAFLTIEAGVRTVHSVDQPIIRDIILHIVLQQLSGSKLSARTLFRALKVAILPSEANDVLGLFHKLADSADLLLASSSKSQFFIRRCSSREDVVAWAKISEHSLASKVFSSLRVYRLMSVWACLCVLMEEITAYWSTDVASSK
ncbi:unnamed protein product [Haemonchus placei]|uniref:MI domain-containing protein n=1 Tax=Haemonchus placei TaxID=6290 RepID=A0A0N4W8B5_HAEPC|nr:unnamed protein product [Haemonchus placei]